jgi:hypothetical protein
MKLAAWLSGGLVVAGVAGWAALSAAGAGHGTYQPAALLFPYTMVIAALVGSIPAAALAIAAGQYPAYGVLIAQARRPGSKMLAVVAAHAVVAAVAVWLVTSSEVFR